MKSRTKNIIVLLVTILLVVVILEVGLRIATPADNLPRDFYYYTMKHSNYNPFLIFGPNINQLSMQENGELMVWNAQGFRLKEEVPPSPPDDEYRLIALGGSTTENMVNGENLHYCGIAEDLLENEKFGNKNKKVRCLNAASSGYSSAHSLIRLQFDLLYFKPDMVTVMHNINDLTVNFFPWEHQKFNYANKYLTSTYAKKMSLGKLLVEKSRILIALGKQMGKIKTKLTAEKIPTADGNFVYTNMQFSEERIPIKTKLLFYNNLKSMVQIAKAHDIAIVLMSQPAVFDDDKIALLFGHEKHNEQVLYPQKQELQKSFELYNDIIKSVAEEEGVYFIDMYKHMGHDEDLFFDMVHYSPKGVQRFGEIYSQELKKILQQE